MTEELFDTFTETADEEAERLPAVEEDLRSKLDNQRQLSTDDYKKLSDFVTAMAEIFSPDLPIIGGNVQQELLRSSQEINIGRLLREKSLVRIYQLLRTLNDKMVPLWATVTDNDTGEKFQKQEEFLGWFCAKAGVSRALVFQRTKAYQRMVTLGFTLEEAYERMKMMPSAITEGLRELGTWDKEVLISLPMTVAKNLTTNYENLYDEDELSAINSKMKTIEETGGSEEDHAGLADMLRPAMREAVTDAAFNTDRANDALKNLRHGIGGKPEFRFTWRADINSIVIVMSRSSLGEDGNTVTEQDAVVEFIADSAQGIIPGEVVEELYRRLPFTNKKDFS